jgi:hypothetical protein
MKIAIMIIKVKLIIKLIIKITMKILKMFNKVNTIIRIDVVVVTMMKIEGIIKENK